MLRSPALGIALTLAALATPPAGAVDALLRPGAYEVQVRLELPNLDDMRAANVVRICVGGIDAGDAHGLKVLSDNNPLGRCPLSGIAMTDAELTFDIVCPGGNAARASARFVLSEAAFNGRITMKMGGKNMTMTETQTGRRIGECAEDGAATR